MSETPTERTAADEKRHRARARSSMRSAVTCGKLDREPCEVCGDPTAEGHHEDYDQPLKIRWLCRAHHAELHRGRPHRRRLVDDPAMTAELQRVSATIRQQQVSLRSNEDMRNGLIQQALADGWTHAQIAEATGLTRGRINQLAHPTGGTVR